jgi:hypothetical protein
MKTSSYEIKNSSWIGFRAGTPVPFSSILKNLRVKENNLPSFSQALFTLIYFLP